MVKKLRITGVILVVIGLVAVASSAYAYVKVQDGAAALQGFSDAQNVTLSYNADGELIDRGTTDGADAILALLRDEWMWPVNEGELDSNDPLVDTATEYMYQMATIAFHVLNGTQTVVLDAATTYDANGDGEITQDETFAAGTYEVPVEGKYWSDFDRQHPLEGPARAGAWTGTVHGLFAELGVGATTASSLQLGLGIAAVTLLMGVGFLAAGGGLLWAGMGKKEEAAAA